MSVKLLVIIVTIVSSAIQVHIV